MGEIPDEVKAKVDADLVREILVALCERDGLSLVSDINPGAPAPNYELALRLRIGQVFGLENPEPMTQSPRLGRAVTPADEAAWTAFERFAWPSRPFCPYCDSTSVETIDAATRVRLWKCQACTRHFSPLVDTPLHNCKIDIKTIMLAFDILDHEPDTPIRVLARRLTITDRSAMTLRRRVREMLDDPIDDEPTRIEPGSLRSLY